MTEASAPWTCTPTRRCPSCSGRQRPCTHGGTPTGTSARCPCAALPAAAQALKLRARLREHCVVAAVPREFAFVAATRVRRMGSPSGRDASMPGSTPAAERTRDSRKCRRCSGPSAAAACPASTGFWGPQLSAQPDPGHLSRWTGLAARARENGASLTGELTRSAQNCLSLQARTLGGPVFLIRHPCHVCRVAGLLGGGARGLRLDDSQHPLWHLLQRGQHHPARGNGHWRACAGPLAAGCARVVCRILRGYAAPGEGERVAARACVTRQRHRGVGGGAAAMQGGSAPHPIAESCRVRACEPSCPALTVAARLPAWRQAKTCLRCGCWLAAAVTGLHTRTRPHAACSDRTVPVASSPAPPHPAPPRSPL